jgi:hypothetical protein
MVTIFCMCMVVYPTGAIVPHMSDHDEENGGYQQPGLIADEKLFGHQKSRSNVKQDQGLKAVVVFPVAVPEGIGSDSDRKGDHSSLEPDVVDDIDAKKGQRGE